MRRTLSTLLLIAMLAGLGSCGSSETETGQSDPSVSAVAQAETEPETGLGVSYPVTDMGGATFQIMNGDRSWDMNVCILVDEESPGDFALNDAMYQRNNKVEEMMNCNMEEYCISFGPDYFGTLISTARQLIAAGDSTYQCMYLPISLCSNLILEGGLYDLQTVSSLQLEEDWWDQLVIDAAEMDGKTYFATGCAHMMPFDCSWCIYFNEDMFEDYGLTAPYALVDEGKWTIDQLLTMAESAAQPNESGTFTWEADSQTLLYGISAHSHATEKFFIGSGGRYIPKDASGWQLISDEEAFYDIVNRISGMTATQGAWHNSSDADQLAELENGGYVAIFGADRSLFLTGEVKTSQILRDMESTYGLVPMPKGNESQDMYYTPVARDFLQFTIPVTNGSPDEIGLVIDALSYEGYVSVLPVYYDITVSHKGLRNEESIRMLDYIRKGRTVDIGMLFGWTKTLNEQIVRQMYAGKTDFASVVAQNRTKVETEIQKFVEYANEN